MKIGIESVVTRAKRRLGLLDTTKWDAELESLVNEGALHLNNLDTYTISCGTFDVECTKIHIPQATEIIAIKNTISTECCTGACQVVYDQFSVDNRFMQCGCNNTYFIADRNVLTNFEGNGCYGGNVYSFNNGYISFPSNSTLTEAKVWYRGYNEDENGIMIIDELQQRGLSAYAAAEFATSGTHYGKYAPKQVQKWERIYVDQKAHLAGKAQVSYTQQNKGKFAAIARAILINPVQSLNANL